METTTPETKAMIETAHVIASQNPQQCIDEVNEFVKDKSILTKVYNTTPVITGADKLGRANTLILTTCLITFMATPDEKKAHETKSTLIKA